MKISVPQNEIHRKAVRILFQQGDERDATRSL